MEDNFVLLKTNLGQLRGQIKTSMYFNKSYCAFQGIPYGKPPIGDLRFKAPQPYGGWNGVRDALKSGNSSKQKYEWLHGSSNSNILTVGDEDCLHLNVYTKKCPETSIKTPVMVYIHGGGFTGGCGGFDFFGPDFFMNEDVVLVTVNYRCGVFGFLSLENEEVPGNAGLRDQTLALQWVKDNIHSFGGDPNNVTIFGLSAGGASVSYQLLSQTSKGLFHKAIIQSGSSNDMWAFQPKPRYWAIRLAKVLGCTSDNDSEILRNLQSVTADDLVLAVDKIVLDLREKLEAITILFKPCVEVAGENPFLSDTPENLMGKGHFHKVPVILGRSENEGSVCVLQACEVVNKKTFEQFMKNPVWLVPLPYEPRINSSKIKEVGDIIWDFYFKDKTLPWQKQSYNFQRFGTDVLFYHGMQKTRNLLLEKSPFPVFSYLFTNHTRCYCSPNELEIDVKKESLEYVTEGTCHCADEAFLAISRFMPNSELSPEHREAIEKHIKAWCTFASVGDPNCKELGTTWEMDSVSKPCFMEIGTSWTMKDGIPLAERAEFWKNLFEKFGA